MVIHVGRSDQGLTSMQVSERHFPRVPFVFDISNSYVEHDREKAVAGQSLSPLRLVRATTNERVVIADVGCQARPACTPAAKGLTFGARLRCRSVL